jgi:tRNA (uracil-5-)-methyltransferase TRM9
MKQAIRLRLIDINRNFYHHQREHFSATRQHGWHGWKTLIEPMTRFQKPSILDLGCGNGRFGSFLANQKITYSSYLGIDSNAGLLNAAKGSVPGPTRWLEADITNPNLWETISDRFDVIVLFGVLHHIPGFDQRHQLLKSLHHLLVENGLLIASFWQPMHLPAFSRKRIDWSAANLDESEVEPYDYLLNWDNDGIPRYCHHFTNEEIDRLIENIPSQLQDRYEADKLNHYVVWTR